jgi:hypothetical protein
MFHIIFSEMKSYIAFLSLLVGILAINSLEGIYVYVSVKSSSFQDYRMKTKISYKWGDYSDSS